MSKKLPKIEKICLYCKQPFYILQSADKRGHHKFCNIRCRNLFDRIKMKGSGNPAWNGGKIQKHCLICNKEFYIFPSALKYDKRECCSQRCGGILNIRRQKSRGDYHPYWKGGITSLDKKIRTCIRYIQWRTDVFVRDDFTCQKCGQRGGKLNAHHPELLCKLMQEAIALYPNVSKEVACHIYYPIWNLNSGITLCEKCHKSESHNWRSNV